MTLYEVENAVRASFFALFLPSRLLILDSDPHHHPNTFPLVELGKIDARSLNNDKLGISSYLCSQLYHLNLEG